QNFALATEVADHIVVLGKGRVRWNGTSEELRKADDVRHTWLGISPARVGATIKLVKPPLRSSMPVSASLTCVNGKMRCSSGDRASVAAGALAPRFSPLAGA